MDEQKINIQENEADKQNNGEPVNSEEINKSQEENATTESENTEHENPLAKAEEKIEQLKDQLLRQAAEFDNYRKRTIKEKSELILNGGEKVISALLPIMDDLERAADNFEKTDNIETLKEGVNLIISKLEKTLSGQGLQKIDAIGKEFDTDFHEAIALIPATEDSQKGLVIDCTQTGYTLNNKVIRHAKVVVAQ